MADLAVTSNPTDAREPGGLTASPEHHLSAPVGAQGLRPPGGELEPDRRRLPPLRLLGPIGMFILFLLAWKGATTFFAIKPFILPPPEAVIQSYIVDGPYLLRQLGHTVLMAISGFSLAAVIGVSVAVLFSQSKLLEFSLYPYAILLQTTPIIAIAPLIVIWAGIGDTA